MANDTPGKEIAWIVMANSDSHVRDLLASMDKTGTVRSGDSLYVKHGYSSMGKAYQDGQDEAAGDGYSRFVYLHQDVRFVTDVREELDYHLGLQQYGWLGLAGSRGLYPHSWWDNPKDTWQGQLLQGNAYDGWGSSKDGKKPFLVSDADLVDGFFLATNKTWRFPDYEGIHFLDTRMCLSAINAGFKNGVMNGVVVQHLSQGKMDEDYRRAKKECADWWKSMS